MTAENSGTIFFAHAGGLADVQFVLEEILQASVAHTYQLDASFSGSSAIIVRLQKGDHQWTFADSFWLMRDSLAKIGKSLGMLKTGDYECPGSARAYVDGEFLGGRTCGHGEGECIFYAPQGVLLAYNEQDCKILYQAIRRMEEETLALGGELQMTIASTAMRLFRGAFLHQSIQTNPEVNLIAREAYVASRVEPIMSKLQGPANIFDFNSSFPFSMTKPQPRHVTYSGRQWENQPLALVQATVKVPDCHIPPIPYRMGTRVFFPTGAWSGWFWGNDLNYLEACGGEVQKVKRAYHFDSFDDMGGYVETLYAKRKKTSDEFLKIVYKYYMNSLYGKTAERPEKDGVVAFKDIPKNAKRETAVEFPNLPGVWSYEFEKTLEHEHVPIAVNVTSLSRELLCRALHKCDPAYCDTDSIFTKDFLGDSLELGELKHEASIGPDEDAEFMGAKLYRFGDKTRAKGFSMPRVKADDKEAKALEKEQRLDLFAKISRREQINFERMMRVKEVLKSGDLRPRDKHRTKQVRMTEQPKRCPLPDGRTRPWNVEEIIGKRSEPLDPAKLYT